MWVHFLDVCLLLCTHTVKTIMVQSNYRLSNKPYKLRYGINPIFTKLCRLRGKVFIVLLFRNGFYFGMLVATFRHTNTVFTGWGTSQNSIHRAEFRLRQD